MTENLIKNVFISTGQKQVMHTLWVETIVKRPAPVDAPIPAMIHYNYLKNLPIDEAAAITEAKKYAKEHNGNFLGVLDSPQFKKAGFFDMFNMHFTQRRKRGKTFFMGTNPSPEFWDAWRANKEEMKKAGFSVSKFRNPMQKVDVWYVFYKPDEIQSR